NNDETSFHVKKDLLLGEIQILSFEVKQAEEFEWDSFFKKIGLYLLFSVAYAALIKACAEAWLLVQATANIVTGAACAILIAKAVILTISLIVTAYMAHKALLDAGIMNLGEVAASLILLGIIILRAAWTLNGLWAIYTTAYLNWQFGFAMPLLMTASAIAKFGLLAAINLTIVGITLLVMGLSVILTGEL
ncbi:MAG: hypothetical protein P1Q69_17815, partial [Candidatus Thorarchaeota archaeon]|nr:hypothetical protein [Candidatus Thorarchaeota archaeon]